MATAEENLQREIQAVSEMISRVGDSTGNLGRTLASLNQQMTALRSGTSIAIAGLSAFGKSTGSATDQASQLASRLGSAGTETERLSRRQAAVSQMSKQVADEMRALQASFTAGAITEREYAAAKEAGIRAIREAAGSDREASAAAEQAARAGIRQAEAQASVTKITEQFGKVAKVASGMFDYAGRAAGGMYQGASSKDPIAGAAQNLNAVIGGLTSPMKMLASGLIDLAGLAAGGGYRKLGIALLGLGGAANTAAALISKFSSIVGPVSQQMSEYLRSFQSANALGMTFARGMGDLRDSAGQLGVRMDQMIEGIARGEQSFRNAGMSTDQARKALGAFGRQLMEGEQSAELFGLGFTEPAEKIALMASALERARLSGSTMADALNNVGSLTREYAKDLKVMQAIVGKNAEKEMEKARAYAAQTALQTSLNADQKKSAEGVFSTMQGLLGPMADKMKIAVAQVTQGGTITDAGLALDKNATDLINRLAEINKSGLGVAEAGAEAQRAIQQTANAAQEQAASGSGQNQAIASANLAGGMRGNNEAMNTNQALNDVFMGLRGSVDTGRQANADANQAGKTAVPGSPGSDPTTTAFNELVQKQREVNLNLEQAMTQAGVVRNFAALMTTALEPTRLMVGLINDFGKQTGETIGLMQEVMRISQGTRRENEGPTGNETIDNLIRKMGETFTPFLEGLRNFGNKLGEFFTGSSIPQFAAGGIVQGSPGGFLSMLHGNEAVIPLPDNVRGPEFAKALQNLLVQDQQTDTKVPDFMSSRDFSNILDRATEAMSTKNALKTSDISGTDDILTINNRINDMLKMMKDNASNIEKSISEASAVPSANEIRMNVPGITDIANSIEEQNRAKAEEQRVAAAQAELTSARPGVPRGLNDMAMTNQTMTKQEELMERIGDQISIMNSRMEESMRSLRSIENHTDRTARGVA